MKHALILQETERHIVNIESKLKELLSQKAKSKGKSILYKNDDGFVEACLEDVKSDFSRQQHALYLRNEYRSQRKRSFPSDIEQGLIEMRSSCCELNVIPSDHIDQYITIDLTQKNSMNSQNNTTDETSQTSKQSQGHCSEEEDEVSVQLSENSLMYPANTRNALDKTYSTEMTPRMEALLKTPDKSLRPKRPYNRRNRFVANQVKTAGLKHHQELSHVPANKNSIQRFKARLYKDMVDRPKRHSPEKSFKQLLFDTNSGFTPLKLPENHLISPALPHPSVSEILENSPLTALTSELKNQCDGLPDNNGVTQSTEDFDDPSNLFCTESIDQMDLDDSFDRDEQTTPNCRTSKKRQIKREIDRQHSRKFRTRIRSYNDYEHEESQSDSGPVYTIKREARKCRRQLEKSFPAVEIKSKEDVPVITGVFENTDNSCRDFDGYFLFYQQMAEEKHSDNVTEIASEVSQMWQNLSTDTRDTFVAMAAHETSHSSSSDLSEDLIELDVKPLKDGSCFRTSTPTPLQPSCSQVVPISENTDFKHLGFKMGTQVQANIDLQMVPTQPLCDFNGATSILLVKPDIIQLDENYIADEVILTSQDYEVPSLPDEVPEEKALDLSMERHSSTENRFTNDHDLQSVSWNTQVVPKMDFAAFLQHDLF